MKIFELKGTLRENLGKKASKLLRKEEKVPCVLYGGTENVHFSATDIAFRKLIYTPSVYIVNLDINGNQEKAILKDLQFHPVSDKLIHVDFLRISEDENMEIGIPVNIEGFSKGVAQGGKLKLLKRKLIVRANYKSLPETLNIDVTELELGKSIKIKDLSFDNIELIDPKNSVVVSVKLTRAAVAEDEDAETSEEGASEEGEAKSE